MRRHEVPYWLPSDPKMTLNDLEMPFLRATAVPAGTAEARISYGNSVCPSVCLSQPGGILSPDEIETPGLHHMIAQSL